MNLHNIASGFINVINPFITVTIQQSTGYTVGADGKQVPSYQTVITPAQIQALSGTMLEHANNLNLQGILRTAYLNGDWEGAVRVLLKGGDIFQFNGQNWLVVHVIETWPDWSRVIICLQQ